MRTFPWRHHFGALVLCGLLASSCASADAANQQDCAPTAQLATGKFVEIGAELGLRAADDGENQFGVFGIAEQMAGGVAVHDLDGDGWDDVVATYPNRPPRVLLNRCGTHFADVTVDWLPVDLGPTTTALAADFNGDQHPDLFLGGLADEDDRFLLGTGSGFSDWSFDSGIVPDQFDPRPKATFGATAADVDLDGDLDLFISRWADHTGGGFPSQLFLNDGSANFADATAAGLENLADVGAFTATFTNWDDDLYPELFIAADFGTSKFFDATGPATYVDRTDELGVGTDENGMASVVADLNGDGVLDWFVGAIHFPGACPETQFGCTGNRLFEGTAQGTAFTDVTDAQGVREGNWSWGTIAEDLNGDGLLDIAQVGGAGALSSAFVELNATPARLWLGTPNGAARQDAAAATGLDALRGGRGLTTIDVDQDGDLDLISNVHRVGLQLFRNDLVAGNRLTVRVLDDRGAPSAEAVVFVTDTDGTVHRRDIRSGDLFAAQRPLAAHFGFDAETQPVNVRVTWPDGTSITSAVEPGQHDHEVRKQDG